MISRTYGNQFYYKFFFLRIFESKRQTRPVWLKKENNLGRSSNKLKENSKKKPINYYRKLKYDAEKYIIKNLKNNNIKYCIGRIFSFTHYKQNKDYFVPSVFNKIMSPKKNIVFKNVNIYRDFIHLKDLLKSIKILFKFMYFIKSL